MTINSQNEPSVDSEEYLDYRDAISDSPCFRAVMNTFLFNFISDYIFNFEHLKSHLLDNGINFAIYKVSKYVCKYDIF